ncbi:hypothetical protein WA026_016070 [Henosepilachna vigintioctopunctata]|uniref:Acyl-coenzyme A thioesterase 13 n=1 Tax=Henosepilachna vigintioctopunctata TaxID=420089 RepID=A0AAW1U8M4_9CUCU
MVAFTRKFCSSTRLTAEYIKNYLRDTKNYEQQFKNLKIITMEKGTCIAEMDVEERHTNAMRTLHGGCTATLVDSLSSYGLSSLEKGNVAHVSVNLNIRYMQGGEVGKKIVIESVTTKCGKNLAFLDVTIKDKESGRILAKGEHTKYLLNSPTSIGK